VKSFRITVAPHFTCIVKETKVIRPYNRKLGKDVHTPGVTPTEVYSVTSTAWKEYIQRHTTPPGPACTQWTTTDPCGTCVCVIITMKTTRAAGHDRVWAVHYMDRAAQQSKDYASRVAERDELSRLAV